MYAPNNNQQFASSHSYLKERARKPDLQMYLRLSNLINPIKQTPDTAIMEEDPSNDDIALSSSLEIDAYVNEQVNFFLMLKSTELQLAYHASFNLGNQTLSALLAIVMIFTGITFPFLIIEFIAFCTSTTVVQSVNSLLTVTVISLFVFIIWRAYFQQHAIVKASGLAKRLPPAVGKVIQTITMCSFMAVELISSFKLMSRVIGGDCGDSNDFLVISTCNPAAQYHGIPDDACMIVMFAPLLYAMIVKGAHFRFSILLWIITMLSLIAAIVYSNAYNSVLFVCVYFFGSVVVLVESRKSSYFHFFTHRKLQETLQERQKAADEANATELRHMIANVAHDMKTPLASFLCGTDFIHHMLEDIHGKRIAQTSVSSSDVDDFVQSVLACVTNMRNTNSFMLMTINRCIDYTKASKGVKLVPKFETLDLLEALSLPLNCMKDIQQRVTIVLETLVGDICSHIITDKQWMQENVLCLLSNAVKYSHDGTVTICVATEPADRSNSLHEMGEPLVSTSTSIALEVDGSPKPMLSSPSSSNEGPQMWLRIEVEDHGIGLSDEAMATLFSPFKQAQRLAGGTGLGLFSMAKRIEALEGRFGVKRRRDGKEGSLFWFAVPYRPDAQVAAQVDGPAIPVLLARSLEECLTSPPAATEPQMSASPVMPSSPQSDSGKVVADSLLKSAIAKGKEVSGLDILIVDDSPAILKMTTMLLKRHKHIVSTATNGAEAVKMVNERLDSKGVCFDAILMDLQMPVMDGLEATRRLRVIDAQRKLQGVVSFSAEEEADTSYHQLIIAMSANSDANTEQEAYNAGIDAFIAKPFSLELFYNMFEMLRVRDQAEKKVGAEE